MTLEDKRILILGAGGMLGQAVYHTMSKRNKVMATDIDVNEEWLQFLDIRNLDSILAVCKTFTPQIIINLAAITDIEFCERNPQESFVTNGLGQENVCLAAHAMDATAVYVSTAGIFDGEKEFYDDYEIPQPKNVYAKSKYHGELHTSQYLQKYFTLRAGWMMGGLNKDKKFVKKIFDQLQGGKKELFIVNDKSGSPTYTWDFAQSLEKVLCTDYYGLYNMVCRGAGSRFDVACEIVETMGLTGSVKINLVSSQYFEKEYYAFRPDSEKLVNLKLQERKIDYMRDWRVCLKEYVNQLLTLGR